MNLCLWFVNWLKFLKLELVSPLIMVLIFVVEKLSITNHLVIFRHWINASNDGKVIDEPWEAMTWK